MLCSVIKVCKIHPAERRYSLPPWIWPKLPRQHMKSSNAHTFTHSLHPIFLARTQPIIVNATADMLKDHILPVAEKLRDNAKRMEKEEQEYASMKRSRKTDGDCESYVQEVNKRWIGDNKNTIKLSKIWQISKVWISSLEDLSKQGNRIYLTSSHRDFWQSV